MVLFLELLINSSSCSCCSCGCCWLLANGESVIVDMCFFLVLLLVGSSVKGVEGLLGILDE